MTVSLVIETENLKGGAGRGDPTESLARLLAHLRGQSFSIAGLKELVITHEGLPDGAREKLEDAAGQALHFVEVPAHAGYYGSKDLGFDATSAEIVAFADADCWPAPHWLEALTSPFHDGAQVVAGRTAYREGVVGEALTTIDFLYFKSPLGEGCTRNFYANNVAFRREVFQRFRYGEQRGFYRGTCQVLGMRLQEAGIPVRYVHEALTTHRLPDERAEWLRLRLLRGGDSVTLAPHLARSMLPRPLHAVTRVPGLMPAAVLAGRLAFSVIEGARARHPLAVIAVSMGASAVDAAGAIGRGLGLLTVERAEQEVLSYHSDRDRLVSAA